MKDELQSQTVNWLQRVIIADDVYFMLLAESFIDAVNKYRNNHSCIREMKLEISDGYTFFKAHCCFDGDDGGKTISSVKVDRL